MDAEEIARLVKDLRVSSDTHVGSVTITEEEARKGLQRLEKVVVGKNFSRRSITREMLCSNLPRILRVRGSTEIEVVGHNLFVISFSLESDKRVALEEGPWHFFQDLMILKQSLAMQTPMEVDFDEITLWVQCHNVPIECMTPSIITRIGEQVGKVEDVDVGEGGTCVGKFARVRVTRAISKPLVRCVPVKQEGLEKDVIIILQYEKLPDFCFLCGRVGHISRDCTDSSGDDQCPRFDSWLRAGRTFVGRREVEGGNRERPRPSGSGGSSHRWVALRSNARVDESVSGTKADKEVESGEGSVGEEQEMVRGVLEEHEEVREDMEVVSVGGNNVLHPATGLVLSPVDSHPVELGGTRECAASEGVGVQELVGKGKEVALTLVHDGTKVRGKKWKRLARAPGSGLSEVGGEGLGLKGRKRISKRRETCLRDEEEEEDEDSGHRRKAAKVVDEVGDAEPTAEAAGAQPRRTL